MKVLKHDKQKLAIEFSPDEFDIFRNLLRRYPAMPTGYYKISREPNPALTDDQHLLDEALEETRRSHRAHMVRFLASPEIFKRVGECTVMDLRGENHEWLLQILNEIRVGLWIKLGSPEDQELELIHEDKPDHPDVWAMEACGFFISLMVDF